MKRMMLCVVIVIVTLVVVGCHGSLKDTDEAEAVPSLQPSGPQPLEPQPIVPAVVEQGGGFTKEQRMADAQMIVGLFERGYAPLAWKEEILDFSFRDHSNDLLYWAEQDISDEEFYGKIGEFVAGFHDSHTSHVFPASRWAALPFSVDDVEGRIIVKKVNDESLAMAIGDELISLCGEDPRDARDRILNYIGEGNPRGEIRIATAFLTERLNYLFPTVPEGACAVTIKSRVDGTTHDIQMEWDVQGYPIAELNNPPAADMQKAKMVNDDLGSFNIIKQARMRIHPLYRKIRQMAEEDTSKPFFKLWDTFDQRKKEPFLIGTFEADGKRIGFVRIDTYAGIDFDAAVKEFAEEIPYLEENTDAMVIDQTGNPGGDVCFGLDLGAFFFTTPQKELHDRWRANRENLTYFEMGEVLAENENDRLLGKMIADDMREAMKRGDQLTDPFPNCRHDGVFGPHVDKKKGAIAYTKPVLMLIDELAASAGDYFPALMQDLGRAVMFGKGTIGAGGVIKPIEVSIGYSEMMFSYTISLGWREQPVELADGTTTHYIENVGVIPEIEYDITIDDVVGGYTKYRDAVDLSVISLIKGER